MRCFHHFAHIWLPSLRIKTYRLLHGWATRKDTWFFVGGVFGCWKTFSNPGDQRTEGMQVNSDPQPPRKTSTQNSTNNHPFPKAHLKKKKHPVNISQQLFWTCVFEKKHHGGLLGQKVRHANRSQALDFVVAPENRRLLLPLAGKFGVPLLNSIDFSLGEKRSQEFQPHELFLEGQAFLNIHVNMEIDLNKM